MDYINYLVTPLDKSLSHMSSVLDNFEDSKCGKLLQINEFRRDDSGIPDDDVTDDHDICYYANCDASVWMRSCEKEVIEPLRSSEIIGSIPQWLTGTLLRNGPGNLLPDGRILVKPELLCDVGCETPRINVDSHLGKEYRYFYAISCDMDQKTKKMWQEKGVYPSEPIFVPDPNGKSEDDGVVVSSIVWAEEETRVGLLILDAVTFTEVARATFDTPGPVPKCLHGWFSLDK